MDIFLSVIIILAGYLIGSIPTSYIVAKTTTNIDLRNYGSGTVSGSMVYEHVSRWVVVPVGIFDILKGAIPTWLALQLALGEWVAAFAGLAAVAGHNWPVYLRFTGGRGLSPFMGVMLVLFPWGFLWLLIFLGIGFALGDSAPWALASLISMPILVYLLNGPPSAYLTIALMIVLTLVKRLEANQRPLPSSQPERRDVVLRRLFYDRDIIDHKDWINRTPDP